MTPDFRIVCETCRRDIVGGAGAIHVDLADVTRTQRERREYDERQRSISGPDRAITLGELMAAPPDVHWHIHCDTCNPHREPKGGLCGGCYCIDAAQCRTWPDLVKWTVHLSDKTWLDCTDWMAVINGLALGSSDVGLVAAAPDRAAR